MCRHIQTHEKNLVFWVKDGNAFYLAVKDQSGFPFWFIVSHKRPNLMKFQHLEPQIICSYDGKLVINSYLGAEILLYHIVSQEKIRIQIYSELRNILLDKMLVKLPTFRLNVGFYGRKFYLGPLKFKIWTHFVFWV